MRYNKTDGDCRYRSLLEIVSPQWEKCYPPSGNFFPKHRETISNGDLNTSHYLNNRQTSIYEQRQMIEKQRISVFVVFKCNRFPRRDPLNTRFCVDPCNDSNSRQAVNMHIVRVGVDKDRDPGSIGPLQREVDNWAQDRM